MAIWRYGLMGIITAIYLAVQMAMAEPLSYATAQPPYTHASDEYQGADTARQLNLAENPTDNLILEQILRAYILSGNYEAAVRTGLFYFDPQFINRPNWLLIVQAVRLSSNYDQAGELLALAAPFYPDDVDFDIENRLLALAEGRCSDAVKPVDGAPLTPQQKQLLAPIATHCPVEWDNALQLAIWIAKPSQQQATITEFDAKPNSFINQICLVFDAGCGPITTQTTPDYHQRLYWKAAWVMRHLRADHFSERIAFQITDHRAFETASRGSQVYGQYVLALHQNIHRLETGIAAIFDQEVPADMPAETVLSRAARIEWQSQLGRKTVIRSAADIVVSDAGMGEHSQTGEHLGLKWHPHPFAKLDLALSQFQTTPPAEDLYGPSVQDRWQISWQSEMAHPFGIGLVFSQSVERFEQILYYLDDLHQVEQQQIQLLMDRPFGQGWEIWMVGEMIESTSDDPLYQFDVKQFSMGIQRKF